MCPQFHNKVATTAPQEDVYTDDERELTGAAAHSIAHILRRECVQGLCFIWVHMGIRTCAEGL